MAGRPRKYSDEVLAELERRYPNENTEELAEQFRMTWSQLNSVASSRGWRKAGRREREAENIERNWEPPIIKELEERGAKRRNINSGAVFTLPGQIVHVPR